MQADLEAIFAHARELTAADRDVYLNQVCAGNPTLRAEVEVLLRADVDAGSFLEEPAAADSSGHPATAVLNGEESPTYLPPEEQYKTQGFSQDEALERERLPPALLSPSAKPGGLGRLAHYEVLEVLGQGAFGIVLKAFDEKLHRMVAIKVMSAELAATSPARKRFLREARASAAIRHENVVAIHAVEEEPVPYLVMEYVPGQTLHQAIAAKGPFDVPEVLRLGQQMAQGLAAAHAQGLIHRDIKPANILLENGLVNRVKITDFGLARAADDASLTQSGVIAGTPMYMSPEQAHGQKIDQRSDLFSLGSVLYVMLSGRPPFRAETTLAVLKRVTEDTPRSIQEIIPEVPTWLSAMITKLHAKSPADRFQSAAEVAQILENCSKALEQGRAPTLPGDVAGETTQIVSPVRTSPPPVATTPVPLSRRFRPLVALLLLLIGVGLTEATGVTRITTTIFGLKSGDRQLTTPLDQPAQTATTQPTAPEPAGWHGWPADAPPPAIAPFDAEHAKQHQEAWAKYLQIDVEYTNSLRMKFVLIPPGEFTMGSTPEEIEAALKNVNPDDKHWQECIKSEAPQHKVILTQPIYLGVNEVTQAEYEKVMGTNPSHFAPLGGGKEAVAGMETSDHPVEVVSWNDAVEFCARLSKQEKLKPFYFRAGETIMPLDGTGYRLPSEAEWEFACRAGTATKYWIGDKDEDVMLAVWFGGNSEGRTHPAGELKANPFGLYDIHGNVWEWVQDGWDATWYGQFQEIPAINPNSPFSASSQRVVRGGHWDNTASFCRSSGRNADEPPDCHRSLGFRVSLPIDAVRPTLNTSPAPAGVTPATAAVPIALDLTPPVPLGTWQIGPEPPWYKDWPDAIKTSDMLPGLIDRPAKLARIKRWNVDTVWSRGIVNVVRWSPDGKWIATGSTDGHVRIYDAETMRLAQILPGMAYQIGVTDLAWHPDSDRLAVAADNTSSFRIWSRAGNLIFEESGRLSDCTCVAWSSDGQWIAVGGVNSVRLCRADGTSAKTLIEGRAAGCWAGCVVWSPDNQRIVGLHYDGKARIWTLVTGEAEILAEEIRGHSGYGLAWSSKDWIALTDGANLRLYDPDRKLAQTVPFRGWAVAWHPDGERVLLADGRVWDYIRRTTAVTNPLSPMGSRSHATAIASSPDGRRIAIGRGLIRVYSTDFTQTLFESPLTHAPVTGIKWSPDGRHLASATLDQFDSGIRLWAPEGKQNTFMPVQGHNAISGVAWSPDSTCLVGTHDQNGTWLSELPSPLLQVRPGGVASVAWNADGLYFAIGTVEGKLVILDRSGEPVAEMTVGTGTVHVAWSRSTNVLAAHCGNQLYFCKPEAGWKLGAAIETEALARGGVEPAWSPDGELLSLFPDEWYNREGKRVTFPVRPYAFDWRADSEQYLSQYLNGGISKTLPSGTKIANRRINGHWSSVRWHPRGHLIATGTDQGTITAWDASNLQPYWHAVLLPEQKSATFSAAGELLDGDPETVEKYLVYYVEREDGRIETLKPSEFQKLLDVKQ